jgi:hypothetical protein
VTSSRDPSPSGHHHPAQEASPDLLSAEDCQGLIYQSDHRAAGRIEAISDEIFAEFENAVETYAGEDEVGRA